MDNIEQAKQVLRSQAMAGMRETMKKVAREVFEEEIRPLLGEMVLEVVNATLNIAVKPYEIGVATDAMDVVWPEVQAHGGTVAGEPALPVEPDITFDPGPVVGYSSEQPPEKKRRRWWR